MRRDGLSFSEAVQTLGQRAGINEQPPESREILRRFSWKDTEGREAWHLRWNTGAKFSWARDRDAKQPGQGEQNKAGPGKISRRCPINENERVTEKREDANQEAQPNGPIKSSHLFSPCL